METYEAILTRRSIPALHGPAPSPQEIERLLTAAVMAPNHHVTEPWRFVVLRDEPVVRELLGVKPDESLAGFVYLGHVPAGEVPTPPRRTPVTSVTEWRGFDRA